MSSRVGHHHESMRTHLCLDSGAVMDTHRSQLAHDASPLLHETSGATADGSRSLAMRSTLRRRVVIALGFAFVLGNVLFLERVVLLEQTQLFTEHQAIKMVKDAWRMAAPPPVTAEVLDPSIQAVDTIASKEIQSLASDSSISQAIANASFNNRYQSNSSDLDFKSSTRGPAADPLTSKTQFVMSLYKVSQQQPHEPRGIVLPLYNHIAKLGMSLILELRARGVDLPIEIPHCDDLDQKYQYEIFKRDPLVRIYDVCEVAVEARTDSGKPLFCENRYHCYQRFRGFDIKIISVVLSRFQEVMLMDADTLYFRSPTALWESEQYKNTGTFFFHDRIGQEQTFLSQTLRYSVPQITLLEDYLSRFDVKPFGLLPTLNRTIASSGPAAKARAKPRVVHLDFEPSDILLSSHSWNHRSGHEVDSSLLLWDKDRQPRATAILASFVSMLTVEHPPGYGDKELFFLACELAETNYAFSDVGVGSIGVIHRTYIEPNGRKNPVLCGDAIQFLPTGIRSNDSESNTTGTDTESAVPLYFNGDSILTLKPSTKQILRTRSRAGEFYNGSNRERGIPLMCLMDMKILKLTLQEQLRISQRQNLHDIVHEWVE